MTAPSIFESFNAKDLSTKQIAASFVRTSKFDELCERNSTLLIGPRGSGKTTLMRMMEIETLSYWDSPNAQHYKDKLDFTSVFIPTDRIWKDQLDSVYGRPNISPAHERTAIKLVNSLFTSHVLYRLAEAMDCRLQLNSTRHFRNLKKIDISAEQEVELVEELASVWGVTPRRATFQSLVLACSKLKVDIANKTIGFTSGESETDVDLDSRFTDFTVVVEAAIEIFGKICGVESEKWALLFDELELAPTSITKSLVTYARGKSEKILFKLSLVPYIPDATLAADLFSPQPGQDVSTVILWHSTKDEDPYTFFENLTKRISLDTGLPELDFDEVLESPDRKNIDTIWAALLEYDSSLRLIARDNNIPKNTKSMKEKERAETIRKMEPVLRTRLANTEFIDNKLQLKRRKRYPDFYGGKHNLSLLLEGNPRWIIGVMRPLILEHYRTDSVVPIWRQMEEIQKAAQKFLSMLKTIPCARTHLQSPMSVIEVINQIGDHISNQVNLRPLRLDVPSYFRVNPSIAAEVKLGLGAALNAGALIYMSGKSQKLALDSLDDREFRICHLLTPHYRLPLSTTDSVSLSSIFSESKKFRNFKHESDLFQNE